MTQETKLPLCEAIRSEAESTLKEIDIETPYEKGVEAGIRLALELNDKHFSALSVEDLTKGIYNQNRTVVDGIFDGKFERDKVLSFEECKKHAPHDIEAAKDAAKAVMQLLRKE